MGESALALWCGQAGLIHNKSGIDATGWDYLIEFPARERRAVSSLHDPDLQCRVQVKSSDHRKGYVDIALSNVHRLATAPLPAFFLIIEFDQNEVPQRAFLVHVDQDLIYRALEALALGSERDTKPAHRRTLRIRYSDQHRLQSPSGSSFATALTAAIGPSMLRYVDGKKRDLENAGYDNQSVGICFSTATNEDLEQLIDVSLGLAASAPITNLSSTLTRFGIKGPNPQIPGGSARIEIFSDESPSPTVVRFRRGKLSPAIAFSGRLHRSALNPIIPEWRRRIRIECTHFDIILSINAKNVQFRFGAIDIAPQEWTELRRFLRVFHDLKASSGELYMDIALPGFRNIEARLGPAPLDPAFADQIRPLVEALDKFDLIANGFEFSETFLVSVQDLVRKKDQIGLMAMHFEAVPFVMRIESELEKFESPPDLGKTFACTFVHRLILGSVHFCCLCTSIGHGTLDDAGLLTIYARRVTVHRKFTIQREQGDIDFQDELREIATQYDSTHNSVLVAGPGLA